MALDQDDVETLLRNHFEDLSEKETDFLEGLQDWEGEFTPAQEEWLGAILEGRL